MSEEEGKNGDDEGNDQRQHGAGHTANTQASHVRVSAKLARLQGLEHLLVDRQLQQEVKGVLSHGLVFRDGGRTAPQTQAAPSHRCASPDWRRTKHG